METLRTFIAIELSTNVQNAISTIEDGLKKTGADVKWVKPANIHLTLKFLGDTPVDKIEPISKALEICGLSIAPFALELTCLGAFPKIDSAKVVWLGVTNGKEEAKQLALTIQEKLGEIGLPKEEREFEPHLTLGRVRSPLNRFALIEAVKACQITEPITLAVDHITLIKSVLTPQGPIYEVLKRFELKAAA